METPKRTFWPTQYMVCQLYLHKAVIKNGVGGGECVHRVWAWDLQKPLHPETVTYVSYLKGNLMAHIRHIFDFMNELGVF